MDQREAVIVGELGIGDDGNNDIAQPLLIGVDAGTAILRVGVALDDDIREIGHATGKQPMICSRNLF